MLFGFLERGAVPKAGDLPPRAVAFQRRGGLAHLPVVLVAVLVTLVGAIAWIGALRDRAPPAPRL